MADEDFTITVDNKEYKVNDLDDDNRQVVAHLRDLERQMQEVNFRFEQLNASKAFFSERLITSIRDSEAEETNTADSEASEDVEKESPKNE